MVLPSRDRKGASCRLFYTSWSRGSVLGVVSEPRPQGFLHPHAGVLNYRTAGAWAPAASISTASRKGVLPPSGVRDMFGLSESPAVFVQCEQGSYHVPAFARARAVDPETGREVPAGDVGLLELTVPLTTSYPLLKILTTDKVVLRAGCSCGRPGPHLTPRGRATAARYETCAMQIGRSLG